MVAEKLISALSQSLSQNYGNVTLDDVGCRNLTTHGSGASIEQYNNVKFEELESTFNNNNEDKDNSNGKNETNHNHENEVDTPMVDFPPDNFYEVVVSFQCKFCMFVASEESAVKLHVNQLHSTNSTPSLPRVENQHTNQNQIRPELLGTETKPHVSVLPSPTTELVLPVPGLEMPITQNPNKSQVEDDIDSRSKLQDETHDRHRNLTDADNGNESEKDEVFFCSQCGIIFSSALLCCNHMAEVHELREFSTDLIRENPVNSQYQHQPSPPKRKRIRCCKPSQLPPTSTLAGDKLGHSKFLRSKRSKETPNSNPSSSSNCSSNKSAELMCKLCKTKYNTVAALETHEKCHISSIPDDFENGINTVTKSKSYKSYQSYNVKGYVCCYCDCDATKAAGAGTKGFRNGNPSVSGTGTSTVTKFLTWAKCALHLWKVHQVDCELYFCSQCPYKTPTSAKLKDHELLHKSHAKFTCSTCRKSFKQRKQLKNHEKYHKANNTKLPPESEARWYTPKECPVCSRILSDSKCLKKHISAVHNKMKPYVCNICGHTSARKAELQLHIRQHTGEKPYKCPACTFTTGDHNSLRKHKLRHDESKTRPYECSYCDYAAIQSHAFKKHVLAVHPGQEIVFVCSSCGLVCVNENTFDAHSKDHKEGRIPVENSNETNINDRSGSHGNTSTVSNVDESTRASSELTEESIDGKMSASKFWLRDEDSMEVVDTGGITIPAPSSELLSGSGSGSDASIGKDGVIEAGAAAAAITLNNVHTSSSHLRSPEGDAESETSKDSCTILPYHNHSVLSDDPEDQDENSRKRSEIDMEQMSMSASSPTETLNSLNQSHSNSGSERLLKNSTIASPIKCFGDLNNLNGLNSNFGLGMDESRALGLVGDLLSDNDCINHFFNFDPALCSSDSIDLPDLICNDHSNDGTLEKLLNMNVTGFS